MSDQFADAVIPVAFGERLAGSQAFFSLFREGMTLVEETAAYLDGPGRTESKKLQRTAALTYATESMRLTTRLMQLASWLLLHRAVKEGEMSLAQANKEKSKVKLAAGEPGDPETIKLLPERLRVLIDRSKKLERNGALAYATESMRLTTRLMQLASWLLLHRAVKEGEMSLAQANKEKAKVKIAVGEHNDEPNVKLLPARLCELIQRSKAMQNAVRRLDATIHAPPPRVDRSNPVERQLGLLKAAFEHE